MEIYTLDDMFSYLTSAILNGFVISAIPFIVGLGIHGILKILKSS